VALIEDVGVVATGLLGTGGAGGGVVGIGPPAAADAEGAAAGVGAGAALAGAVAASKSQVNREMKHETRFYNIHTCCLTNAPALCSALYTEKLQ
jgi:hypothetical protein